MYYALFFMGTSNTSKLYWLSITHSKGNRLIIEARTKQKLYRCDFFKKNFTVSSVSKLSFV